MARKIYRAISDTTHTTAVIETASSGGQWGQPVKLSTVQLANEDLDALKASRINGNPKIKTIEQWEVNAASKGPKSRYGKTLKSMLDELPGHVQGHVMNDTGRVELENLDGIQVWMKAETLRRRLDTNTAPAPARYATDDWAPTPDQTSKDLDRLAHSLGGDGADEARTPSRARSMRL